MQTGNCWARQIAEIYGKLFYDLYFKNVENQNIVTLQ
ncbi:hypothetical protein MTYM_01027 [Methylococcales bacterium]|nr:hypothetical protein MTYM_01027 [Methylococcales bacterium]